MGADERYSRQRRLPEVGDAGQERLERASVLVAAGPAAETELAYLARAGIGQLLVSRWSAPEPFVHRARFRHPESARLGAGAWRALRQIRGILEAP